MRLGTTALALAVLLLAAPSAVAESVPTTLYAHVIGVQDMPINLQRPPDGYTSTGVQGTTAVTLTCLGAGPGSPAGLTQQPHSTAYGYSSPNLVEYGQGGGDGQPRPHPERGLAADAVLDPAVQPVLVWYVATGERAAPDGVDPVAVPPAVPGFRLRATMRAGDGISIEDEAYNEGPVLMQATSPPVTLLADQVVGGDGAGVTPLGARDGLHVYEVRLPLDAEAGAIPRATGFNLRIDLFIGADACDPDEGQVMPFPVGAYQGPGAFPRLELAVLDPLTVSYAAPQWVGDDLVLHIGALSAWGAYDIDRAGLTLDVKGPGQARFALAAAPQRFHEHGRSYANAAVDLAWVWEGAGREAPPGHYNATLRVPNLQGTATLEASLAFTVDPPREAPAPALPILALALLAALLARRRR